MVKIKRFEVVFNSPTDTFYAGQQVTGKVVIDLSESMTIRAVKLRYTGETSVSFPDLAKKNKSNTDKEIYFDQSDIVHGAQTNQSVMKADNPNLTAGVHEFPFSFRAAEKLPSSFESKHGHVRYFCKAYLHRPWKFDITAKKPFSIVSIVDLNQEPLAFTPGFGHSEHRFSLRDKILGCLTGGLTIQMKIPRSAYVPGEQIHIQAEVQNNSSEVVRGVEAYINQNVTYSSSKGGARLFPGTQKIALLSQGSVPRGEDQIWHHEALTVPPLPPTKLGGCKLISIDYQLKFVVSTNTNKSIVLTLPIVIGTIPLHQQPLSWLPAGVRSEAPPVPPRPVLTAQPSAPPLTEYLGPPPSYEECVHMDTVNIQDGDDNQHTYGDMTYRPRYPIYPTLPRLDSREMRTAMPAM